MGKAISLDEMDVYAQRFYSSFRIFPRAAFQNGSDLSLDKKGRGEILGDVAGDTYTWKVPKGVYAIGIWIQELATWVYPIEVNPGDDVVIRMGGGPFEWESSTGTYKTTEAGGFNGGGDGVKYTNAVGPWNSGATDDPTYTTAGYGATDIRINGSSLANRVVVVPGQPGSGASWWSEGEYIEHSISEAYVHGDFPFDPVMGLQLPANTPQGPLDFDSYVGQLGTYPNFNDTTHHVWDYSIGTGAWINSSTGQDSMTYLPWDADSGYEPGVPRAIVGAGGGGYGGGARGSIIIGEPAGSKNSNPSSTWGSEWRAFHASVSYPDEFRWLTYDPDYTPGTPAPPSSYREVFGMPGAWGGSYVSPKYASVSLPNNTYSSSAGFAQITALAPLAILWRSPTPWSMDNYLFR